MWVQAWQGNHFIEETSRYASTSGSAATRSPRAFGFTIGDPNLRGGVTRIEIIVCRHELSSCDHWYTYLR